VIDTEGFRANVGMIVAGRQSKVLWAGRAGQDGWQFPQGGIRSDENPQQALYRELYEELGLKADQVRIVGATRDWLRYTLPRRLVRKNASPPCIGQKQIWYLLRLMCDEREVRLDASRVPEFDRWKWVSYWHPSREVVYFKRAVYRRALKELAPLFYGG